MPRIKNSRYAVGKMTDSSKPSLRPSKTKKDRERSLSWRLILPVPVAVILSIAAIALIVPRFMAENARTDAIRQGQQIADQFKTIRGYYTKNVIKKVVKSGSLKPSFSHKDEANGVPLPATFIHDISALLAKKDMTVNLYSGFPFPVRKDRKLDEFPAAGVDISDGQSGSGIFAAGNSRWQRNRSGGHL